MRRGQEGRSEEGEEEGSEEGSEEGEEGGKKELTSVLSTHSVHLHWR